MSQVNILRRDENHVQALVNAMCAKLGDQDLIEKFGIKFHVGEPLVDVVVTVNGVEVDFIGEVADFVKMVDTKLEEHVHHEAVMLWESKAGRFRDLADTLTRAADDIEGLTWAVRRDLEKMDKEL